MDTETVRILHAVDRQCRSLRTLVDLHVSVPVDSEIRGDVAQVARDSGTGASGATEQYRALPARDRHGVHPGAAQVLEGSAQLYGLGRQSRLAQQYDTPGEVALEHAIAVSTWSKRHSQVDIIA